MESDNQDLALSNKSPANESNRETASSTPPDIKQLPAGPSSDGLSTTQTAVSSGGGLHRTNHIGTVMLYGVPIVSLFIDGHDRLCLAQISNVLLKDFSYNEIHNRRVALGINCVQCTPVQLEILRRAGAMPISSRRCGMITKREAVRLVKSFLEEARPPRLPDNFAFEVDHKCGWGGSGQFVPSRYNSSRAKCVKCDQCALWFSPNNKAKISPSRFRFIFHHHKKEDVTGQPPPNYHHPDAANFNSWRRHLKLKGSVSEELENAWEDVKAMFNGGSRRRLAYSFLRSSSDGTTSSTPTTPMYSNAQNQMVQPSPAVCQNNTITSANASTVMSANSPSLFCGSTPALNAVNALSSASPTAAALYSANPVAAAAAAVAAAGASGNTQLQALAAANASATAMATDTNLFWQLLFGQAIRTEQATLAAAMRANAVAAEVAGIGANPGLGLGRVIPAAVDFDGSSFGPVVSSAKKRLKFSVEAIMENKPPVSPTADTADDRADVESSATGMTTTV